jgi:spermidine/putrescine transport system substrate-binding protein
MSRRDLFKAAGVGAGALGLSQILAACGSSSSVVQQKPTFDWGSAKLNHVLNFANWPYYIDTHSGQHPTLEMFTKQTGIKVNYRPAISDNATFFATIKPQLQAGKPTPWDLMVITNGSQLSTLIANQWLIPLDHSLLPNFAANASKLVTNPTFDPGNKYTVAWQSGFTGIAYSPDAVQALGHVPNSVNDLWDPKVAGHVGMMSDNTELGSVALLKLGIEPSTSTVSDWQKAATELTQQKSAGIVRNYYDQSYVSALENGDTWITQAWSGDIFQANQSGYPALKFFVPQEGVMFWTDNMMIPAHAQNPLDALTYIDYVYKPDIAAQIADWVWYVTPVPAAQDIIANQLNDPTVAKSPLVFPTPAFQSQAHGYYDYKNFDDEKLWTDTFQPIIDG